MKKYSVLLLLSGTLQAQDAPVLVLDPVIVNGYEMPKLNQDNALLFSSVFDNSIIISDNEMKRGLISRTEKQIKKQVKFN